MKVTTYWYWWSMSFHFCASSSNVILVEATIIQSSNWSLPLNILGTVAIYPPTIEFSFNRQRLLVIGGGGAVGFAAIQLAVAAGCHVRTTCGNQSINRVMAAGAEQAVDYTAEVVNW